MAAKKASSYVSRPVDKDGNAAYTSEENSVWHDLIVNQKPVLENRACDEYIHGMNLLDSPHDRIPQCPEVSKVLKNETGWQLEPVPALIPFDEFFNLLANKKFPAATFIRRRDEIGYIQEPDIFHEIFGHCPLLTNQAYADFTHTYGKLGLKAEHKDRVMLAKLYWFTVEFGLINTQKGIRAYGGGIMSSPDELVYAVESGVPKREPFNPLEVLRTPYRIDIKQPIYYVINSFDDLFKLTEMDLISLIHEARELGMHEPLYTTENN